ncbi:MAG: molybdopterin cofactor-binding domain-containing protein, partial [Bacteroidota bacterium]
MLKEIERHARAAAGRSDTATRPTVIGKVGRRAFLQGGAAFALAVQFLPLDAKAYQPYAHGGQTMPNGVVNNPLVFVTIDRDGTVTIKAHRSEMGTGSRTSIPMVVADEMEADWSRVRIVQAEGDEKKYGNQDTDGSRSLRHHIQPARDIGAAVRRMLEEAAAQRWQTDVANVRAVNHEVVHKSLGVSLGYGELAEAAMALPVPARADLSFKDEKEFRYIGKGQVKIVDLHDITTGKAVYAADVRLPGMLTAVIARPPVVGGSVKSFDAAAAEAVPGVVKVVEIPGSGLGSKFKPLGGIAVVARSTWAAINGRDALAIEWEAGPHGTASTKDQERELRASASAPGTPVRNQGDAEAALASAARVFTREYYQQHMAHAAMEPPAAVASFAGGKCEVWGCLQSPYGARVDIADFLGLGEEDVTVHVTLLGGGFGRKSKCDFAIEAAYLSREVGAPVRVQWTREDDIRHGYYNAANAQRLRAALDAKGAI